VAQLLDQAIAGFDLALRAIAGVHQAERPTPGRDLAEDELSADQRRRAAALMRVNHVGEVCAQALYQGQALTARNDDNRRALGQAAHEEQDHLAWSAERIEELGGRLSLLNPLWYAGALAFGAAAGLAGDRWSLAFLAETERQVEAHLEGHLAQLAPEDLRTRAIVEAMRDDEAQHRATALELGAAELPEPLKLAMRAAAKVMTTLAYRI
jgi:ubiquinone biosynthesis monooxygenase Coq7